MINMGMRQKNIFDFGRRYRQFRHYKIIFTLFHSVVHKEKTIIQPFHQRTASCYLMSRTDKSDFHCC